MGILLGGALIIMGVAFLLAQLELLGDLGAWDFWPLILILVGILKLAHQDGVPDRVEGVMLLAVGILVQLHYLGVVHLQWKMVWPVLIIVLGLFVLWSSWYRARRRRKSAGSSPGFVAGFVIFGGKEDRIDSKEFEGGEILCVMGGYELDLRDADLREGEAVLHVRAIMGGIEIRIPEDWSLTVHGTPIMGAFEDKTRPSRGDASPDRPRLILEGSVIMGGVEIRN
jgi:predicted membrane protein